MSKSKSIIFVRNRALFLFVPISSELGDDLLQTFAGVGLSFAWRNYAACNIEETVQVPLLVRHCVLREKKRDSMRIGMIGGSVIRIT